MNNNSLQSINQIPDEKITLDNILSLVNKEYSPDIMKQYILRDLTKYQIINTYYKTCIKAYYGESFYNELLTHFI